MKFVRKRLLERPPSVTEAPVQLLADTLRLLLVTVQRGLTDMSIKVGELDQEVIETVRPDPAQAAQLADYREVFHTLSLRFPGYVVNAQAALLDPPTIQGTSQEDTELLRDYV